LGPIGIRAKMVRAHVIALLSPVVCVHAPWRGVRERDDRALG
jgi:hypothetical protein